MSKDLCERIEFAEHQEVCPKGYDRKKPNDHHKACVAEKEVPPTFICPPGYWMKSKNYHAHHSIHGGNIDPDHLEHDLYDIAHLTDTDAHVVAAHADSVCVKTIKVAPSLTDGHEYSACRPGQNGDPSCEMEMRHYAEIDPKKLKKAQKTREKFGNH
eukprot:Selendium_serpulae@DN5371_c0_g1_i1.p1